MALTGRASVMVAHVIGGALIALAGYPALAMAADTAPEIAWKDRVEVAAGDAYRGPWRMNDSEFRYVDDPSIALDDDGDAGVIWADQENQDLYFQRYGAAGEPKFDEPVNVSGSPGIFSWLPRVVLSRHEPDHVYVLWQEIIFSGGSHGGETLFARSTDGGRTFGDPINLSETTAGAGKGRLTTHRWDNGSLDIVEAPEGTLHVAWTEYEGALRFARSTDGGETFSEPRRIAGGEDALPARGPSLAADEQGSVYLAWTVGEDQTADIRLTASRDAGETFKEPRVVAATQGHADAPKIALDAEGVVHLVYMESADGPFQPARVHYTRGRGGDGFHEPMDISAEHGERFDSVAFPSLAVAGESVYVLWELFPDAARRPSGLGLVRSHDGGERFSAPETVPGTDDTRLGFNGSLQGLLMRKLAVNEAGDVAIVNSTLEQGEGSYVLLIRGTRTATDSGAVHDTSSDVSQR
ncbi:sialidase family protein [Aquisalimonas sp.]|uniref:sialidase family protein n=1 Tax=Aquisalimonas sp. TaxID=1872621 RepID=UPI0025C4379D|nr:sialidase family protein [Aquisalimonas sp.]